MKHVNTRRSHDTNRNLKTNIEKQTQSMKRNETQGKPKIRVKGKEQE